MSRFQYRDSDKQIEDILGYYFQDKSLLVCALTSNAFSEDMKSLAQIGDAALKLVLNEFMWKVGIRDKGRMTQIRELQERGEKQNLLFSQLLETNNLDPEVFLRLSKGELVTKQYCNIYKEFLESLLGAVYLDGGMKEAKIVMIELGLLTGIVDFL